MKRVLFFLLCIAACVSCGSDKFNIEAVYTAPDGTDVYLIDIAGNDTLAVTKVKDNSFSFTGQADEGVFAYVGHGNDRVHVILEPGTIKADLDERIANSPLMDVYNAFHTRFYGYDAIRNEERKALEARQSEMSPKEFSDEWDRLNEKYAALQVALADSVVRAWPDNLVGALALDDMAYKDTARFMSLYNEASDRVKSFRYVANYYKTISILSKTAPGKMFLDYTVKGGNPDGSDVSLSDYIGKGKYILLDHWASWCGPCKAEIPAIRKAYDAFKGDRFDVVSIACSDRREDTVKALAELDMPWNQILDAQKIPVELYGVATIPHLILFAPDGTILKRGLRGEQIYSTLQELL